MKKIRIYIILAVILSVALPAVLLAQGPIDPEDTPIDGGLSLLLAAGAAYGVKKYRNVKRKNNEAASDI